MEPVSKGRCADDGFVHCAGRTAALERLWNKETELKRTITILLLAISVMSCRSHSQSEAEIRLRKYFQLSPDVVLESKPSPILNQIPGKEGGLSPLAHLRD